MRHSITAAISLALTAAGCGAKRDAGEPSLPQALSNADGGMNEQGKTIDLSAALDGGAPLDPMSTAPIDAGMPDASLAKKVVAPCVPDGEGRCDHPLPPAPEHLANKVKRGGPWVPASIGCVVSIDAAIPAHGQTSRMHMRGVKVTHFVNPDAHPKRIAARYGNCSTATSELLKKTLREEPTQYGFFIEENGALVPLARLNASLNPIDTPEKLALYLEAGAGNGIPFAFRVSKDEQLFERNESNVREKPNCYGCTDFEYTKLPSGEFEVLGLSHASAHIGGCATRTTTFRTVFRVSSDGTVIPTARTAIGSVTPFCVGRAPEGYDSTFAVDSLGAYLEKLYRDESASIVAFLRLAKELAARGADSSLVARAKAAAKEEVEHAKTMGALAESAGHAVTPFKAECPKGLRSTFEIARENRLEGCVSETFAAAIAAHQAKAAHDVEIRVAMARIANDEASHATLAWDVDAWLSPKLSADERAILEALTQERIDALRSSYDLPVAPWRIVAGEPGADAACAILDSLEATLWKSAA